MTSPADVTPPRCAELPIAVEQAMLAIDVLLKRWMAATAENADPMQGDPTVGRVVIETIAVRKAIAGMVPAHNPSRAYLALGDLVERAS